MPNLTVPARQVATGDVFDIASHATMTVHRVDSIGYTHVRIAGSLGDPSKGFNPDPAVTASITVSNTQELYVRRAA